jgi:hypothetical protein
MRVSAVSAIKKKIIRSSRRSPGAEMLLDLTSTSNTVALPALRFKSGGTQCRTEFGWGCLNTPGPQAADEVVPA